MNIKTETDAQYFASRAFKRGVFGIGVCPFHEDRFIRDIARGGVHSGSGGVPGEVESGQVALVGMGEPPDPAHSRGRQVVSSVQRLERAKEDLQRAIDGLMELLLPTWHTNSLRIDFGCGWLHIRLVFALLAGPPARVTLRNTTPAILLFRF